MANDSMRGGPRGSSDQAALLQPITVQLADAGGLAPEIDESSTTATDLFRSWGPLDGKSAGYKVNRLFVQITEDYAQEGENLTVGTYTFDSSDSSFDAVDADAFVLAGQKIPNSTQKGVVIELTLDGAGAFLDPTSTDPDNSNYLVGGSSSQFLAITSAGNSGGGGKFVCFAELIPVSGTYYSD